MVVFCSRARRARPGLLGAALLGALAFNSPVLSASAPATAIEPECRTRISVTRNETELAAVAAEWRRGRPLRIVAIGYPSTAGIGTSAPSLAYPAQLDGELDEELDGWSVSVVNLGIGGETAEATVERLKAVGATDPSLVIWQVGTNDALKGGDEAGFRRLVEGGIAAARSADVGLMLIDPQDFPGIKDRPTYERFVRTIQSVADENQVPLFSRYALMQDWKEDSPERLKGMLAKDSFHMGDRGYRCLAQHLSAAIGSAIRRRREVPPAAVSGRARPVTAAGVGHRIRD